MTDAPLLDAIVFPFIESAKRDGFNGVVPTALLRLQPDPEKLRASLSAFIRDGQVTAVIQVLLGHSTWRRHGTSRSPLIWIASIPSPFDRLSLVVVPPE